MKTTKMKVNVANYRMSLLRSAVMRMTNLAYILSDIEDTVVPLNKELAGCLKYSIIEKRRGKRH